MERRTSSLSHLLLRLHSNSVTLTDGAEVSSGKEERALSTATDDLDDEEDERVDHSGSRVRESRFDVLGSLARLPPTEEREDVESSEEAIEVRKKSMNDRMGRLRSNR